MYVPYPKERIITWQTENVIPSQGCKVMVRVGMARISKCKRM